MSIQHIAYVLDYSRAEHSQRLVLISIANHTNDENDAIASVETYMRETALGERTVQGALKELCSSGELQLQVEDDGMPKLSKYGTRIYRMLFPARQASLDEAESAPPQELRPPAERRAVSAPKPTTSSGVSSSEVPVAPEVLKGADAPTPKISDPLAEILLAPDSTAQYLISRMSDEWQRALSPPVLIRVGKDFGAAAVLDALRNIREDESTPKRAYPYLAAICRRLADGAA